MSVKVTSLWLHVCHFVPTKCFPLHFLCHQMLRSDIKWARQPSLIRQFIALCYWQFNNKSLNNPWSTTMCIQTVATFLSLPLDPGYHQISLSIKMKATRNQLLLQLLSSPSSSSSSLLCRVLILIFLRQTISLGNTVLQLFCCYYSWCLYPCWIFCTFALILSEICVQCPIWLFSGVPWLHAFLVCCSRIF